MRSDKGEWIVWINRHEEQRMAEEEKVRGLIKEEKGRKREKNKKQSKKERKKESKKERKKERNKEFT